jgi:hypothetical protein
MQNFPALTIKQPFATLVARGIKNIENRTWVPDNGYRGPMFVHAGKSYLDEPLPVDLWLPSRELFTFGAIIGTVEITDVVEDSESPWAIKGQKHWVLANAELLAEPIPWRGQMGLWWPTKFRARA